MNENVILSSFSLEQLQTVFRECITEFKASTPPPPVQPDELITENEAKKILSVSKVSLKKWRDEGRLKFYRIGSRIRYKRAELLQSIEPTKKYGRTAK